MARFEILPTYLTMEQGLMEYFKSGVYIDFPISCRCGKFRAESFAGISIHLRREHGVYLKKDRSAHRKHKRLYIANQDREKAGSGLPLPITFHTDRSLKNTK